MEWQEWVAFGISVIAGLLLILRILGIIGD